MLDNLEIERIDYPLPFEDFLPRFEYKVVGQTPSKDSEEVKEQLKQFLETNYDYLIPGDLDATNTNVRMYIEGFRNAIALVNLFIDTKYLSS